MRIVPFRFGHRTANFPKIKIRLLSAVILPGLGAIFAPATSARADEPVFGFVYTTDLLPKGQAEMEQWTTWRRQKAHGSFNELENRSEFSYGVTDAFQLSGYLNYNWTHAYHNGVDGTTIPPEQFADYNAGPDDHFNVARFVGASVEGIFRVLSPYTDPIGLAFVLEPTFGPRFTEIEGLIVVQKNFLDDRLILASNLKIAPEIRPTLPKPGNIETDVNLNIGISYRFAPNWSIGWEFEDEREINYMALFARSQWTNDGYYTGPTLHFGGEQYFATLTAWEQLPIGHNYCASCTVMYQGRDLDVDYEKFRVRLKVGFYF
jgi:hypothetical protein